MSDAEPVAAPGSAEPPVVPGYTLEALLGRGGSGEVWRAVPRRGGAPVAVKVLVDGDPERQAREAALLGELDHPHLVRLLDVVHQPRRGAPARVALVLDLLEGGSLAALLARRGRLRPGEVVTAIAPVAAALAHAHENGVVHGDLSPGNIVFTAEGRPVLTDLGVARVLGETSAGEVTPAYVDPTVARGGAPGPASDVFGVAAAAFHALTGVAPWNAATPGDTLQVAAAGLLPDLAELAPDAPPALSSVVARGLAADPHDRGTAAAFALDLRHACRPEPVRLPAEGVPDAELGRTGRGPRTELTHQVPGRRRHAAPVAPAPAPRPAWRRALRPSPENRARAARRVALVLGGVLTVLVAVGWVDGRWGSDRPADAAGPATVAAATSAAPATSSVPATTRPRSSAPPSPGEPGPADRQAVPTGDAGWQAVVAQLYARRAEAFAAPSAAALDGVYTTDSPQRTADEDQTQALARAGEQLRGFAPTVVRVTGATTRDGATEVRLVDRWPAYEVVPAGRPEAPALRTGAARAEAAVRMLLVRTPAGWRIGEVERVTS
ncbi:MAG: serine/threonine-protein kinase [Blastococcus sp.]